MVEALPKIVTEGKKEVQRILERLELCEPFSQ